MPLSYPIGGSLVEAIRSPIGYAPNIHYAAHEVTRNGRWGEDWDATHYLCFRTAYLPTHWKSFARAWRANEERIASGHAEIVPLKDGRFRAAVSFFSVRRLKKTDICDKVLVKEALAAPLRPPRNAVQSFTPFGLFSLLETVGLATDELVDPDRPGFALADE
jgi:hypothetical protein